jgi:hypothetical protein
MSKGRLKLAGAVALGLLAFAPVARAGFQLNYTLTAGTGTLAGKNVFCFFAKNDQTGDQLGSHCLLTIDVHFKPVGAPLIFDYRDLNGDGVKDANVSGIGLDPTNPTGTFMRVGSEADYQRFYTTPSGYDSASGATPLTDFANVTDLNIAAFSLNKNLDATTGLGQFYGAAVVPAGININVVGRVAAEKGPGTPPLTLNALDLSSDPDLAIATSAAVAAGSEDVPFYNFSFTAVAPEPGTLALLGVAGVAAVARRRRRRHA